MSKKYAEKAIIFARVSTAEQKEDQHLSLPAQTRILREYVDKGGKFGTIKKVIAEHELDESASKSNRRKFDEAFKIVEEAEEPIAIVVERVDRFQRDFRATVKFDELRQQGKVELHFVSQGLTIHKKSPNSDLMIWDAFVMFAKAYVRQIGDNVSRSIAEAIKRGEFRANAPLGYSYVQTDQRLVQNEKAPLVKQMFELYATGRYSLETLADTMRKKGLREKKRRITINGKKVDRGEMPISSMTVWYVLQNLFYTGSFLWKDPEGGDERVLVEGKNYEPLISKELFDKVQKVLALNNQKKNDQARNPTQAYYKFRKMIKCGWCGCSLTPENMAQNFKNQKSAGAQVNYYHCSSGKAITDPDYYVREFGHDHSGVRVAVHGKIKGQQVIYCPQRWWKESEIEAEILRDLSLIEYDEKVAAEIRTTLVKEYEERREISEALVKDSKAENSRLQELVKNLIRKIAEEKDAQIEKELRKMVNETREKITQNEDQIARAEEAVEIDTDEIIDVLSVARNLKEQYLSLGEEDQIKLLKLVFKEIRAFRGEITGVVHGKKVQGKIKADHLDFVFNEPFDELIELGLWKWSKEHPMPVFSKDKNGKWVLIAEPVLTKTKKGEAFLFL